MSSPYQSLQHTEAIARYDLLTVTEYDVRLDLARDEQTFDSVTTIRFRSTGGPTFVDLKPTRVNAIRFNGRTLDPDLLERGRLPLDTVEGDNELVVDAVMPFRNDGEGLHRSVDPADGKHYVYGMSFMDAAPTIFACFDQPDLKAPYTFHVVAPEDWAVIGNAPGTNPEPGVWEFERTQPLSTYFVTLVAGPYHVLRDEHDGIPLGLSARASIAKDLDADADELFTMTKQCFDEFHRLFGIRYPFGDYHQAFVPEFNAGAMENPGCVTFRDPLIFSSRVTRGMRIGRATTLAHEMAHQWFGNIVTPKWWDDLWLNESFAEYMGNRVTADVTAVHRRVGRQRLRAPSVGADRRPAPEHPPGRRQRRVRRLGRAAGLRRDLVRQGLERPQAAQRIARRRGRSSPASSTTSSGTASATRRCTTCSRAGSAPGRATCRRSRRTGCAPPARTRSCSTARPA